MRSRLSNPGTTTVTKAKVALVRHAASVPSPTCEVSAPHGVRNVMNVETRTIPVLVVDPN